MKLFEILLEMRDPEFNRDYAFNYAHKLAARENEPAVVVRLKNKAEGKLEAYNVMLKSEFEKRDTSKYNVEGTVDP